MLAMTLHPPKTLHGRRSFGRTTVNSLVLSALVICAAIGPSTAQAAGPATIETEYQLIAVPNALVGKILSPSQPGEIYAAAQEMIQQGEAKLFDTIKISTATGQRASAAGAAGTEVIMEPTLYADQQTLKLILDMKVGKSELIPTATFPSEQALCIGSFNNPNSDGTIFIFAKCKIAQL